MPHSGELKNENDYYLKPMSIFQLLPESCCTNIKGEKKK